MLREILIESIASCLKQPKNMVYTCDQHKKF